MGQAYGFVSKGTLSSIYGAVIDVPKEEKAANNDPYCLDPPDSKQVVPPKLPEQLETALPLLAPKVKASSA